MLKVILGILHNPVPSPFGGWSLGELAPGVTQRPTDQAMETTTFTCVHQYITHFHISSVHKPITSVYLVKEAFCHRIICFAPSA